MESNYKHFEVDNGNEDNHFWKILIKRKTKSEDCLMQKQKLSPCVDSTGNALRKKRIDKEPRTINRQFILI